MSRTFWEPRTRTWVPEEEYRKRRPSLAPTVMPDKAPYVSPMDGTLVEGRRQHRAHMRAHDVIERGDDPIRSPQRPEPVGIADDIAQAWSENENG
ncbi:MAG: hypothetical protein ACREEP_08240 [Dongiaceae bacterium]